MNKKHFFLMVLLSLTFIGCKKTGGVDSSLNPSKDSVPELVASNQSVSSTYIFKDEKDRADTLVKYFELANSANDKSSFDRVIFNSFPDSFDGMNKLFGFDKKNGEAPLYKAPTGGNIIKYFGSIKSIPKEEYYDKYINICVHGFWDADNIVKAFGFHHRLSEDTKSVCQVLSKRTDDDVLSVFRFIFDGPHPKNDENAKIFEDLHSKLTTQDTRLAELLKTAYEKVLLQDDGHGK